MRVAINGMGIAGPTLAYWLRRAGYDPVIFEKAPAVRTGGYLIDFWGLGYEIAERMGIIPALRERGYQMQRLQTVDRDGRDEARMDLTPMYQAQRGRFISVARTDLAGALAGACHGIPIHFGVSISAIANDGAGSLVTLTDGRHERFDLIVGADARTEPRGSRDAPCARYVMVSRANAHELLGVVSLRDVLQSYGVRNESERH